MWTNEELLDNCHDQLKILATNCFEFDNGEQFFGLEICHRLRVLLHHTIPNGTSHSIINLLNLESIQFLSTYEDRSMVKITTPEGIMSAVYGLVKSTSGQISLFDFFPYLEDIRKSENLEFNKWWKEEIVCSHENKFSFTRKKIVVDIFANKTGGSHLDPNIISSSLDVYRLENHIIGWNTADKENNPLKHSISPFLATARQIAHELFRTLVKEDKFKDLINQIYFSKIDSYKLIGHNRNNWQSSAKSDQIINSVGDYFSIIAGQNNEPIAIGLSSYKLKNKFGPKDLEFGIIGYHNGKLGIIENGIESKTLISYDQDDKLGICIGKEDDIKIQFLQNDIIIHEVKNQTLKKFKMCFILKDRGSIKSPNLEKNKKF
ncbi:hypothetical protein [Psychroserpens luteus]|uniref:Uncharacterized protein n=1 Tax=Psychroserpens luteus TaxID=1434066 RepID=A0ABW5ZP59_9FLAO|nr:hypothetical protein [Psychroserpens luteus]